MKIHEYQAQELMQTYQIPVLDFKVTDSVEEGRRIAEEMFRNGKNRLVIKAQVHAGGRGKAGGIALVHSKDEASDALDRILGMRIVTPQTGAEGKIVRRVMIVDGDSEIEQELYVGIILDRDQEKPVILASARGGMDIEELAMNEPEAILKLMVDPCLGLLDFQSRNLVEEMGLPKKPARLMQSIIASLYQMFMGLDCSQIEINPLAVTKTGEVFALDAKVGLDESAFYKHPQLPGLRDPLEESPLEVWASKNNLNYIKLDGDIGCMVNGAGLAMATMDTIHLYGGRPANFLDVGGGANKETVTEAFRILLGDKSVKAVLVNIFGGIVRCDLVAEGIVAAAKEACLDRPLMVRLAGTNAAEGMALLKDSGMSLETAPGLDEAAERVVVLALNAEGGR